MNLGRRKFLSGSAAMVSSALLTPLGGRADETARGNSNEICVFTKPFNSISFDELADAIADLGFDGIEAPVRSGGHVEPKEVEEGLPRLVEALGKRDLNVTVLATDVNDPNDPLTEKLLRTAATLGIQRYRMKYFKYDLNRSVLEQMKEWKPQLKDLAALNHDFGLTGLYQNHAGVNYLGAAIWDLNIALGDIPKHDIGVAYDIRHATAEGGMSWKATFNMIQPRVDTVYVKDFQWTDEKKPSNVPLGEGRVDEQFFELLRKSNFDGPISLHEEYLDHRDPSLVPQHLAAIKKDLVTLRRWLANG